MMRLLFYILAVFTLFLSSCGNLKKLETFDDDAYYDPVRDKKKAPPKAVTDTNAVAASQKKSAENTVNNPYFADPDWNRDDYYDYEYAARLRRFGYGGGMGLAYYDPYYTNSYFYDYNPYHYGVSIYNGYSWYGPSYWNYSYNPSYNWGGWNGCGNNYNWGFGYYNYPSSYFLAPSPWTYGYYDPYSYYGNSWWYYGNPYWNNPYYNDPYNSWCGGPGNCNPNYYNSYDYNSYYYGPRRAHSGTNPEIVNPVSAKKIASENPGNSDVPLSGTGASHAPYDQERFNVIPRTTVTPDNYQLPATVTPEWDSKPGKNYGTIKDNPPSVQNSTVTATPVQAEEPKKGFWGKILRGDKSDIKNGNDVQYSDGVIESPAENPNSVPGKNNTVPAKPVTPANPPKKNTTRSENVQPKSNNNYYPVENHSPKPGNDSYTPKNNPPSPPPANKSGNGRAPGGKKPF